MQHSELLTTLCNFNTWHQVLSQTRKHAAITQKCQTSTLYNFKQCFTTSFSSR